VAPLRQQASATAPRQATPAARTSPGRVTFGNVGPQGHRIVLYGPGGIGKTTAACMAPGPVAVFDLDDSLPVIREQFPDEVKPYINSVDFRTIGTWEGIRGQLHADGWDEIKTIIIDSATKAEELALEWTLKNVKHEKDGVVIRRIEDYGFGKGYRHLFDTFCTLMGDLDQHARAGRNVILICHDCMSLVPNPLGTEWNRWEPRLFHSDKNSIRLRVREWADHMLFIGYDYTAAVGSDGKTNSRTGEGRTVYPVERPHCMAKSRTCATAFALDKFDPSIWTNIGLTY
jgi:hypothetical protein